jgi:Mg-chelatase subunit ChlD
MAEFRKEHSREHIKAVPLAAVQQEFVTQAVQGKIDEAVRDKLVGELEAVVSDDARNHYQYEKRNVDAALAGGEAPHKPSVNSPETSLLWAINLAYLAQKKDGQNFYDSKLWKQFASPDGAAQTEKERLAFYVATTGLNKDTRVKWGELGSSFYYSPTDNHINLDLILGMGVGFDIARAVAFHEIGHSQLTKGFGEKIATLDEQIEALRTKGKETSLTQDEYKQLNRIANERHYRYLVADEAENNVVDRWTVNQGRRIRKDHVLARNSSEAILVDGLIGERETPTDTPAARFQNTKNAVRYSFFRNNGYFPDTEDGWRELGVNPDWITTKGGKSGMEALEALKELCGGKDGVENLQPNSSDMMRGAAYLAEATLEYSRKRNQRIEEIYDTFFAHVVEPMLDSQDKKLEEQMQQQGSGQNPPPPGGDKQDGQGNEKGDGKGEGKEGDGKGAGGEPKEGGGKGGGVGDGSPAGGGEEPIKVDGVGEMPGVDAPPTTPKQEGGKPGAGKPAEGVDPGQTIEELEKARTEREGREGKDDDGSSPSSPSSKPGSSQGFKPAKGIGTSNVASAPKVGDWSDYQGMVVAFASEIRARQILIDQLRARQLEYEARIAPEHTLLPEDGDTRRLDRSKHTQLVKRILRGQPVEEADARRFEGDKSAPIPSNMDVVLLVDGSGSMHASEDAKGNSWPFPPIKVGMHAGCIINEACKSDVTQERHANFYLGLWGNKEPLMLVKPGDDKREIGKRIAGVTQSHGWGTSLAPSIRHMTAELAEGQKQHSGANSKTGYSHIIVLSDGGISDSNASVESVRKLLENCPMTSVDFVVVENGKTALDDVANKLKDRFPGRVGVHHHNSTATVNDGLETLLLERIQNTPITPTVTREHKRATLERAHHAMQ